MAIYNTQGSTPIGSASRQLMIPGALDDIQNAIESLGKTAEELSLRLENICTPNDATTTARDLSPFFRWSRERDLPMPNSSKKQNSNNSDSFGKFENMMKKLIKVTPTELTEYEPRSYKTVSSARRQGRLECMRDHILDFRVITLGAIYLVVGHEELDKFLAWIQKHEVPINWQRDSHVTYVWEAIKKREE